MRSSASKIQLSGYDDLFQTNGVAEANGEQTQEVPLSMLFPFKNHPYHVRDDETILIDAFKFFQPMCGGLRVGEKKTGQ